jgi:sugar phosphate isomerase/epimerase
MYKALSPGAVRVKPRDLQDAIDLVSRHGFGGVEFSPREVIQLIESEGVDATRRRFSDAGLKPSGFGLPVDWRGDDAKWREGLANLPALAQAAQALGATRCTTWVLPSSDEREYDANYQFHVERFTPCAQVLAAHGISLGLEFIGPKTLRDTRRHPFVHQLWDMVELGQRIGPNVGLLLDSYHWYTSGATLEDLRQLRAEQVVYVHVNDAPAGVPVDEQLDQVRDLPGATGVIDIAGFLKALDQIGYHGAVVPEPFKQELAGLPSDDARLEVVRQSMDKIFHLAGLE